MGGDRAPAGADHGEDAGEVALVVLEPDLVEGVEERPRIEDVGSDVHLPHAEFLAGETVGALGLEDALDVAIGVAHDASVAGRVDAVGGEERGESAGLVVLLEQPADLIGRDQRLVAREDDERAPAVVTRHGGTGSEHSGAGALPLDLLDDLDPVRKPLRDTIARPHDREDPRRAGIPSGIDHPLHERLAGDPMKHLRNVGAHPSTLAGGHDEDREWRGHGVRRVPGQGVDHCLSCRHLYGGSSSEQDCSVLVRGTGVQIPPPQLFSAAVFRRTACEHMFVPQKIRELPPIADGDLHWLAGLLEGEGSFLAGPPSAPRSPAVQVAMVDRDVVARAGGLLAVAVMVVPSRREGWRTAYSVRVRGAPAVLWMKRLRPLMGTRRREQIDRAVASWGPDPRQLLDDQRAAEALARLTNGETVRQVAERFGTSVWCIYDLRLGRTHAHLSRLA